MTRQPSRLQRGIGLLGLDQEGQVLSLGGHCSTFEPGPDLEQPSGDAGSI